MKMKVGLISDTHTLGAVLPRAVLEALDGVEMILHAGDLVALDVVEALSKIAPVIAVHGNMDVPATHVALPYRTVVEAAGKRIGLIHGDGVPQPDRVLRAPIDFDALHRYLWDQFASDPPECVVYGHTHRAHVATYRGVLMVNPGSATRGNDGRHSVGRLIIEAGQLSAEIVTLS
jgi:putative phosphoesterase